MNDVEAKYYEKKEDCRVRCLLCPQFCVIENEDFGTCGLRKNSGGTLYAAEYGNTISLSMDPIEKKPLYHFKPGTAILSIGPNGCNFSCFFCQNWTISQEESQTRFIAPKELVHIAKSNESIGVAFTYTEPLIWFEYVYDCAKELRDAGLATVLVSNGFINEEPAKELFPFVDAANFDLKSINDEFYRKLCDGRVKEVQDTITLAHRMGVHVEITNLLVPGENDSDDDITELTRWIANLDRNLVLHISRYFPNYKFNTPPTAPDRIAKAYDIAKRRLKYVYTGNISGIGEPDTICPACGATLIRRSGGKVEVMGLKDGRCEMCGLKTNIVV